METIFERDHLYRLQPDNECKCSPTNKTCLVMDAEFYATPGLFDQEFKDIVQSAKRTLKKYKDPRYGS